MKYLLILLLIGCTKKTLEIPNPGFDVIAISNEGYPPLPEQYQRDSIIVTSNSVDWHVIHEADIKFYKITYRGDSIGRVESKGFGENFYSYIYKRRQ